MNSIAIARNAPCPCGSGKRYKDCHGRSGQEVGEPVTAESLLRDAQVAFATGQAPRAYELLSRAAALAPERSDLIRERARVELALGRTEVSEASCRSALDRAPDDPIGWNLLGEILARSDGSAAEAAWQRALELDPDSAETHFHLGNAARRRGMLDAAIAHYEHALRSAPSHAGVLNNLGLALQSLGQLDRAEGCYREVLDVDPPHADALANLATLLHDQNRVDEAVDAYNRAVAVRREFPVRFWIRRAAALTDAGQIPAAAASLREAARLDPDHMPLQADIASLSILQQEYDEAEVALKRALELDADNLYAVTMLAYCHLQSCRWDGIDDFFATIRERLQDDAPRPRFDPAPFPLLAMPLSPREHLNAARRWARRREAPMERPSAASRRLTRRPGEKLRLGYVSSDFREHPITSLLTEVWERHDRTRLETYAYSIGPRQISPQRARIEAAFDRFLDCNRESAEDTARRIVEDGIDVLVDLNGYTTYARSEIFASKPAAIQVSWLGYLGTLGAEWYDYVLTDRFVCPANLQPFFTERFLYLPDCYCPSDTRRAEGARAPDRVACGLPEQAVVFCCFNHSYKIAPALFEVWMRLLERIPGSVLWLAPGSAGARGNLLREAERRGVDAGRLVFAPVVALSEHLARLAHADLFLDTLPYNAGTTANDALLMGVPVLTCAGETMASRVAGSQLLAVGLPELVTGTLADYEATALALAGDRARLRALKQRLAVNRTASPLFDMARFTRNLDQLLLDVAANRASQRSGERGR